MENPLWTKTVLVLKRDTRIAHIDRLTRYHQLESTNAYRHRTVLVRTHTSGTSRRIAFSPTSLLLRLLGAGPAHTRPREAQR